ncbi:MAG: helix-hairpin-helix domain-containing protein [Bacteroidales bacterium]|nr:helix-hairpin-helix domain-containing protein [Bacteroidales bacterium]
MIAKRLTAICCFIAMGIAAFSQNPYETGTLNEAVEDISEIYEDEKDFTDLAEDLWYYAENPLNINDCSYEELARLHFLTDFQIKSLLEYVKNFGPVASLAEIQYIYGFDERLAEYLKNFVTIAPASEKPHLNLKKALRYGRHSVFITGNRALQEKAGFQPLTDSVLQLNPDKNRYFGDPFKIRLKYSFRSHNILLFGFQAEKDAGEEFFTGSNKQGFDFYSGYLQVKETGRLKNLTIGDYQLQFGQGLTLFSGLAFGKSSFSTDIVKRPTGIRHASSADENLFFRGIAGTIKFSDFEFTGFFSKKSFDANLTDTLENGKYIFSSFQASGYHRTPNEIKDEKAVGETVTGTNIKFSRDNFSTGITLVNYTIEGHYEPVEKPYNLYTFRGSDLLNAGIDYRYRFKKSEFFGETSYGNGNWATLNGLMVQAAELASFTVLYRNYSKGFFAMRNNPFSEFSSKNNEQGLYVGTTLFPVKHVKLIGYFDVFKSPWLRYNVTSPSTGRDYLLQAVYAPLRNTEFYLRFKSETKSRDETPEQLPVNVTRDFTVNKLRLNAVYKVLQNYSFKNRMEISHVIKENSPAEYGYYISQDVAFNPENKPVAFWLRFALFDGDTYDSRIYTYENSIPYMFSVPSFFNRGIRFYAMVRYRTGAVTLWLRHSITRYKNIDTIGSGLDETEGNTRSDFEAMLQVKF